MDLISTLDITELQLKIHNIKLLVLASKLSITKTVSLHSNNVYLFNNGLNKLKYQRKNKLKSNKRKTKRNKESSQHHKEK